MRSVSSRPELAAHGVDVVDELAGTPFAQQLVVERRVERNGELAVLREGKAVAGGGFAAQDVVRTELLAGDAYAASRQLLVVTGVER